MTRYTIEYSETYSKEYEVDAENQEDAKDKLYSMIMFGILNPPDNCTDSEMVIIGERESEKPTWLEKMEIGIDMMKKACSENSEWGKCSDCPFDEACTALMDKGIVDPTEGFYNFGK